MANLQGDESHDYALIKGRILEYSEHQGDCIMRLSQWDVTLAGRMCCTHEAGSMDRLIMAIRGIETQ